MRYFPVSIDTKDKTVLCLGAGAAMASKLESLVQTEFTIYVIGEQLHERIETLAEMHPEKIHLKSLKIDENYKYFGYDYLMIGTNSKEVNDAMERRAIQLSTPYLRLDRTGDSSFIMNKVMTHGPITIGVSTGGENPTLTKKVSKDIEKTLDSYDLKKIKILSEIRQALVAKGAENIGDTMNELWDREIISLNKYLEDINETETGNEIE